MCGRYSWKKPGAKRFAKLTEKEPELNRPSFNRAPGQRHPTLTLREGSANWNAMWWGRPPGGPSTARPVPINARSETVDEKPTFRESFESRRCLIPADGFYEWQIVDTDKYPHFIHLPDQPTFAMAGIWSRNPGTKENEDAFAILTQSAHPGLLHLHHRMPVILEESSWEEWLDPSSPVSGLRETLARPGPEMIAYQVGKRVNSTQNDDPDLQDPSAQRQDLLF
jgi:putative SOS response-associated peptidase YedK